MRSFVVAEIHSCLQNSLKKCAGNQSSAGVNALEYDNYWKNGIKIAKIRKQVCIKLEQFTPSDYLLLCVWCGEK